ncbi:MAG: helix-turn-helix transcriptional regulator [Deltaproteobacteria bacterium]|nr:helix-turn-helix transcriptional regulator [Deltaproteobacteria bacterium]
MARGYGQYCPLALSAEILCQRWTILVISRVLDGASRFSEIHRGVPQMSPSLLSRRLVELEEAGILASQEAVNGVGRQYRVTEAGKATEPIVDLMAVWGQHWARDMEIEDLDPAFLVWSMHLRIDTETMPEGRTVLEFNFSGAPKDCKCFWLVHQGGVVDMCLKDPELNVDLVISADLRVFVEAWRGFRDLRLEIEAQRINLVGPETLKKQFPEWLQLSALAPYDRMRPGREKRLSAQAGQTTDLSAR